jgi:hypothetical protein
MNGRIRVELEIPSIASKSNGQQHTWKIDIHTGIVKTPIREPGDFTTFMTMLGLVEYSATS